MTVQLRCGSNLFGELLEGNLLRVKCASKFCGHKRGEAVVFHTFDLATGKLVETKKYRDPRRRINGSQRDG